MNILFVYNACVYFLILIYIICLSIFVLHWVLMFVYVH